MDGRDLPLRDGYFEVAREEIGTPAACVGDRARLRRMCLAPAMVLTMRHPSRSRSAVASSAWQAQPRLDRGPALALPGQGRAEIGCIGLESPPEQRVRALKLA